LLYRGAVICACGMPDCEMKKRVVAGPFCDALAKLCAKPRIELPAHCGAGGNGPICGAPGESLPTIAGTTADISCEACRSMLKADKCAPPGWDPWEDAPPPERFHGKPIASFLPAPSADHGVCHLSTGVTKCECVRGAGDWYSTLPEKVTCAACRERIGKPAPPLADRYAAFRETVERVVREEAPAVRVVTDWSAMPWGGREREPHGFSDLRLDGEAAISSHALHAIDVEAWERDIRRDLSTLRERLGARAMGRK
jgi:hypothetical protein